MQYDFKLYKIFLKIHFKILILEFRQLIYFQIFCEISVKSIQIIELNYLRNIKPIKTLISNSSDIKTQQWWTYLLKRKMYTYKIILHNIGTLCEILCKNKVCDCDCLATLEEKYQPRTIKTSKEVQSVKPVYEYLFPILLLLIKLGFIQL